MQESELATSSDSPDSKGNKPGRPDKLEKLPPVIDLSQSVAGEEDPGAALDLTVKVEKKNEDAGGKQDQAQKSKSKSE